MSADLEFFAPENAPRELLDAVAAAFPGRPVEWLCRHRLDSAVGGYLAGQVRELVRTTESVVRLNLMGTHVLFAALGGGAQSLAPRTRDKQERGALQVA